MHLYSYYCLNIYVHFRLWAIPEFLSEPHRKLAHRKFVCYFRAVLFAELFIKDSFSFIILEAT
jgi:hypothetical protein